MDVPAAVTVTRITSRIRVHTDDEITEAVEAAQKIVDELAQNDDEARALLPEVLKLTSQHHVTVEQMEIGRVLGGDR